MENKHVHNEFKAHSGDNLSKHYDSLSQPRNSLYQIGKWGAVAILVYYLLTEHQAHVFQFLPYLFLLACPLMHIFMHRGHGRHNHERKEGD